MEFKFRNVVLRDMGEADIEDEIRWNTVETQWAQWDAPLGEPGGAQTFDPAAHRRTELEQLKKPKPEIRNTLELDTEDGVHIGSVASYFVDQDFNWISKTPARADPVSCPWSGYQREPLLGKGGWEPKP